MNLKKSLNNISNILNVKEMDGEMGDNYDTIYPESKSGGSNIQTEYNTAIQSLHDTFRLIKDVDSFSRAKKFKTAQRKMKEALDKIIIANTFVVNHKNQQILKLAITLNAFLSDAEIVYNSLNSGSNVLPYDMDKRVYDLAVLMQSYGIDGFK